MLSLDVLAQDVRFGARMIRKAPLFSAVAIASLAVGIGVSTVIFSVANSMVLRPIQAANPDELIQVFTSSETGNPYSASSYADYESFRDQPVFSGLLASTRAKATLSHQERPDVLDGLLVSGNYFDVLGLRPALGRFFRPDENQSPGTHPVVVLSHEAWRRRFGADPAIIERTIELSGRPFTVIGVAPPGFEGTSIEHGAAFFVPAMMQDVMIQGRDLHSRSQRAATILGRMRTGVTLPKATAALQVVAADLARAEPSAWRDKAGRPRRVTVLPEKEGRFADAGEGSVLFILSSVTGSVVGLLAIACVNVATVLLARATTRRKEIAVRLAMGASRRRVIGQLLTECAILATAGGALGLMFAQAVAGLFVRFRPDGVPPVDLTLDYRILLFSAGASLLTVVFFGLAPALQATRADVNAELKDTTRAGRVRGFRFGLRAGLVVLQVAVSLALIVSAALLLRSSHAGRTEDPGFRREGVVSVGVNLTTVPDIKGARARFYREAVDAVAGIPGVELVALAGLVPMDGNNSQHGIRLVGGTSASPDINVVGPDYFALLDVPVKQGREFSSADRESAPAVAVVNETMATTYWNGEAVGRTVTDEETGEQIHIVGVVGDLRHRSFSEAPIPMLYFCAGQRVRTSMTLHIRTSVPAAALSPLLHRTLHEINRSAGLSPVETMTDYFARVTLPQRLGAGGAMTIAVLELMLAVMALYGVIAFSASQRRREIGLRMALGASGRSIISLIMREGLVLTVAGLVIGIGLAVAGGIALGSMLIGVGPADPASFAAGILVLLLVGGLASYIPARRALQVDPSTALRSE